MGFGVSERECDSSNVSINSYSLSGELEKNMRCKTQENNNKKTYRKVIGNLFKLNDGNQQIFDDPFQVLADIYEKGSCSRTYFQHPTVELQHWTSQSVNKTKIYCKKIDFERSCKTSKSIDTIGIGITFTSTANANLYHVTKFPL